MHEKGQRLLQRLEDIGLALKRTDKACGLIGLGSVGLEVERLDEFSDLDFFVIARPGFKTDLIDNLQWLAHVNPIAYCFRNTVDGYKLLFSDGIFCEFAVFEEQELPGIPFAPGRMIWQDGTLPESICRPHKESSAPSKKSMEWLIGEALTNLYVGMCRDKRGEKLSAQRFIQHYAVDRVLELSGDIEERQPSFDDVFAIERRYEKRYPEIARSLPHFIQGYSYNRESALAILAFLDGHFEINAAIKTAILRLC